MIEKILLADSGTGQSEAMIRVLMDLPSIQQASVTILHVVPPQITTEAMTEKWEEGGRLLATAIQSLKLDPGHVTTLLRQGDPKDIVCKVAEETNTDLIIMGSRGLKRIQAILENSVSQYVFQLSSRSMLLVKDDIYIRKLKRILVALDGSTAANQSLNLAFSLLRDIRGGQLQLLHVDSNPTGKGEELTGAPAEKTPTLVTAIAEAKRRGIDYRCFVRVGKPGETICRLATEQTTDLIIMSSPDRRPSVAKSLVDLDRLLGASVSDYVRVHATCPVLLERTPA